MTSIAYVRIGLLVERHDSEYQPFTYRQFYCRQKDKGNARYVPPSEWSKEEVSNLPYHGTNRLFRRMKVGERRRYWVHARITGWQDYWGEYDSSFEVLSMRRCK